MTPSSFTGFSWTSKLKVVEAIGFVIALAGFLTGLACIWQMLQQGEMRSPPPASLYVSAAMLLTGIDLLVKPSARRLPSFERIADIVLRYRAGIGPNDSRDTSPTQHLDGAVQQSSSVTGMTDDEQRQRRARRSA